MKTFRIALFCLCFLLAACGGKAATRQPTTAVPPTDTPAPLPTITDTPTPPPILAPLPEYLAAVYPAPGSQVTLAFYQADLMGGGSFLAYEGSRPVWEVGYRSNVCIYFYTPGLGTPGDQLFAQLAETPVQRAYPEYSFIVERSELIVDGQQLEYAEDPYWAMPESGYIPDWLCWPAPLALGSHTATFIFRPTLDTQVEYTWLFAIIDGSQTAAPRQTYTPWPTRTRLPTQAPDTLTTTLTRTRFPTATRYPTRTPRPTLKPKTPTPTYDLTPAAGPQGYRLKTWTEQDAVAAIEEARWIDAYFSYPYESRWPYSPYDHFDYRVYAVTLEREALLRPLSAANRDTIQWYLLSHVFSRYTDGPLPNEDFTAQLQNDLNTGQVAPEKLKEWLEPRGFEVVVSRSAENLAGDGKPGWTFQVHDSCEPFSPDAVFALFGSSPGEYRLEQIHPWQTFWHGSLDLQVGDHNGNGLSEIVVMTYFYGSGSSTWEYFHLSLFEWQKETRQFIDLTQNIPALELDEMVGPWFDGTTDFIPWRFGPPDEHGAQAVMVPLTYGIWDICTYLTDTVTYVWNGAQYQWAGEAFSPNDPASPISCQVAWALLRGAQEDQALPILQTALEVDAPGFVKYWGTAYKDYFRLQLGMLSALHGRRLEAAQALQTVRDQPEHPEFSMASQLAGAFLDAYPGEQTITACVRTVKFLNAALDEQILRSINFGNFLHDSILEKWGIDDPDWVYDGDSVCDVAAAFRQSLLSQHPQDLEQFVLWLNRAGIPHEIVKTADLTGDGTQDWVAVLNFTSVYEWPVWAIVRDGGGLQLVLIDSFGRWEAGLGGVTLATLRPDPALAPVAVLTQGDRLLVFRLVLGEQLGKEVLLEDRGIGFVDADPAQQEFSIFYPRADGRHKETYSWSPALQSFALSQVESTGAINQDEVIRQIETTLFSAAQPAQVIAPLQAMLAGTIPESQHWDEEVSAYRTVPRNRPYWMYLLGLAYELTGDEAPAVRLYWQIWKEYPANPYALIARHKVEPLGP